MWFVIVGAAIAYVLRYAYRVRRDPANSVLGVEGMTGAGLVTVVMKNSQITDTILHWTESAVTNTSSGVFAGVALLVNLHQSASGLINLITPTSAVIMGGLALSRVGYDRYLRFVLPYFGIALGICIAFMFAGAAIG
jgi:uncharacterized ion transporter superfamily protein YfcC